MCKNSWSMSVNWLRINRPVQPYLKSTRLKTLWKGWLWNLTNCYLQPLYRRMPHETFGMVYRACFSHTYGCFSSLAIGQRRGAVYLIAGYRGHYTPFNRL